MDPDCVPAVEVAGTKLAELSEGCVGCTTKLDPLCDGDRSSIEDTRVSSAEVVLIDGVVDEAIPGWNELAIVDSVVSRIGVAGVILSVSPSIAFLI